MLYLGIDQHAMQLTICIRDKSGNITLRRQVSTRPDKVQAFFDDILKQAQAAGGWVVMLEVCGFNQWLIALLKKMECDDLILIQPDKKSRRKTDRRDAARLSELLWVNRNDCSLGSVSRECVVFTSLPKQTAGRSLLCFNDSASKGHRRSTASNIF